MSPVCHAVVGSAFGDEGKGRWVDDLAHVLGAEDTVVVRFNGGAQAGHTVQVGSARHVFHHWGSGALAGSATHLGPHVVCHPMVWGEEFHALRKLGANTLMFVDPRCPITTPYDVLLNQAAERMRDGAGKRHGSCGMGFGETVERSTHGDLSLSAGDLVRSLAWLTDRLNAIRNNAPSRAAQLGVPWDGPLALWSQDDRIRDRFIHELQAMASHVVVRSVFHVSASKNVIFEGAQGLELDQDLGHFPHVTRSKTGLPHVMEIMKEAGCAHVSVHAMSRAYTTRHGAGPLPGEAAVPPNVQLLDMTNQPNAHQGSLRFAPIDPARRSYMVARDVERSSCPNISMDVGWVVTCVDQVDPQSIPVWQGSASLPEMLDLLGAAHPIRAMTHGPQRGSVQWKKGSRPSHFL